MLDNHQAHSIRSTHSTFVIAEGNHLAAKALSHEDVAKNTHAHWTVGKLNFALAYILG
jgi:hypothetical protein